MARDQDGLSGLWAEASPLQRSEVMRMRDLIGVQARALQLSVEDVLILHEWLADEREKLRDHGIEAGEARPLQEGPAKHQRIEEECAKLLAQAARMVGGALPEPVDTSPVEIGANWQSGLEIPPEGQRLGWRP